MSKAILWIGGAFLAFGLIFGGVGGWTLWSSSELAASGIRAQGTVIALDRRRDSDGDVTYRPVVQFTDENGSRHEFTSNVGSSPPAFSRGESVEVIYDPWSPDDAMIDAFTTRYLLPLAFGGFGLVFGGLGTGMMIAFVRRRRVIAELKERGVSIYADFQNCYLETSTKINGRSPYRVTAQATHPATGKLTSFKSEPVWLNLTDELKGKKVRVLVDPAKPKRHFIDLSQWVGEDERA